MTDGKQLVEDFMKRMEARMSMYEIRGDNLILDPNDIDYDIPLASCSNHAQIVSWVMHLSEKHWFDREMLRMFILAACSYHGLDPRSRI